MRVAKIIHSFILAASVISCTQNGIQELRHYIYESWDATIRSTPPYDTAHLLAMPMPYTVPCIDGIFNELYYWDTYFTNEGLILDGKMELAAGNTEDLLALAERFGFVPNGNRDWYLTRSQPPYLARMVDQIWSGKQDTAFLQRAFPILEKEYHFWMQERITPCGLNRYGSNSPSSELMDEFITTAGKRLGKDFRSLGWTQEKLEKLALDCIAECESGWDFNPRFDRRCSDFCPVDLNANLFGMEKLMANFARLINKDATPWLERAEKRRELMRQLLYDPGQDGWYDYDWTQGMRSSVLSAAVFSLLFNQMLTQAEAESVHKSLARLEYPFGLSVCEDQPYEYKYQWSFPNAWPPTTYIAVRGLWDYGYREDAIRLARKYMDTTIRLFRESGQLWGKTDALNGGLPIDSEYGTPAMVGWSAGTFVYMNEFIKQQN